MMYKIFSILITEVTIAFRIRPSYREGPRSPNHKRSLLDRRSSLVILEEDSELAREAQECEQKMAALKSERFLETFLLYSSG